MTTLQRDEHDLLLRNLLMTHELHVGCTQCCPQTNEITFSTLDLTHSCLGVLLLARKKGGTGKWRPVSRRPLFPRPQKYAVCWNFMEGKGCLRHGNRCSFARSAEEAAVWNVLNATGMELHQLTASVISPRLHSEEAAVRNVPNATGMELHQLTASVISPRLHSEEAAVRKVPNATGMELHQLTASVISPRLHSEEAAVRNVPNATGMELHQLTASVIPSRLHSEDCGRKVSSQEHLMVNCSTPDHEGMMCKDMNAEWRYRDPPENVKQAYKLCERPSTCVYGEKCTAAHSVEELREWVARHRSVLKKKVAAEKRGLLSYQERLLWEYQTSNNEVLIMSETVSGVTVHCDNDLVQQGQLPLKWTFKIQSEMALVEIALLKQEPGSIFSLGENSPERPCTYSEGRRFRTSDGSFDIPVYFKPINPGIYEQWLVFDFDMRPVLLQKLHVRVGEQTSSQLEEMPEGIRAPTHELERWQRGNRVIIPCLIKKEAEEELLKNYKPPLMNLQFNPAAGDSRTITTQNYRERMHSFLYREELAQEELASRLSLQATVSFSDQLYDPDFGLKVAPAGDLFATVPVSCALTPDTPEGFVLRRAIRSSLLCPLSRVSQHQVYEAAILRDASSENKIFLQLSRRCCSDLGLQKDTTCEMEIQFQINRLTFCEMHEAVDLLPDVEKILPDLQHCCVPAHRGEFPKLNSKQHAAMSFIIGDSDGRTAPLLIYGPFGTGKTFTLATATKEVVRQPGTRVLICTHTNSSADLYVKDHFHPYVNAGHPEATPLRIKAEKAGVSVSATEAITLQYCHRSHDSQSFLIPDRATLDKFRVVITTAVMARNFHDLKLPPGYFSHILIDEASQMLECEALMPLSLAEAGTRVVLAGDHMQMGPKLFSVEEDQRSSYTVLNRLFHYYQEQKNPPALKSRIIFHENYRSTEDIVDFVSTHFYVGKSDVIKASGQIPPHPHRQPLRFHHVRGECLLDKATMSWFNPEEISSVVEIVQNLLKEWPSQWGNPEQRTICVLSEGCQVFLIRKELRKRNLSKITVENVENVQGKQFRAVVMTTVHTRDSLLSSDTACLEFFNDPRVLNTAMTRAQSQVIVVGDAAALCFFGKCPKIWKSYVEQCIGKGSADPPHLTVDFLEQEIREISRFVRRAEDESSDTESSTSEVPDAEDPILKELLDERKDVRVTTTAEGLVDFFPKGQPADLEEVDEHENQDIPEHAFQTLLQKNPHDFRLCKLTMERFDAGYAKPLNQPTLRININGRKNIGCSFPGDQVVIEILNREKCPPDGRVIGVAKRADHSGLYVCTFDKYDPQLMTPVNICVSKIYTPFWKDKPNYIALRNPEDEQLKPVKFLKISEKLKRDNLFIVKVLKWLNNFRYPLGVVVNVLPKVKSLEDGLEVLAIEYQLAKTPPPAVEEEIKNFMTLNTDNRNRKDYRNYTTFTIDPVESQDLDDAISVRDLGQQYEVGVHIADIASFVTQGSATDKYAQRRGITFYPHRKKQPVHMFPGCLSAEKFSLKPESDRRAISLMVVIDKKTDRIVTRSFTLSVIRSNRKFSYEEAEEIIQNSCEKSQCFKSLEGCLAVACHFADVHRRERKQGDWYYKQPDEDVPLGRRRSHVMVEELMILFNNAVAERLTTSEKTKSLTPIRCQDKPNSEQIYLLKEKYRSLIPLSIHLSYQFDESLSPDSTPKMDEVGIKDGPTLISPCDSTETGNEVVTGPAISDRFYVFTSLLKHLESAAQDKDVHRMIDLITTDDVHPKLLPVLVELRKFFHKADFLRSNSTFNSRVGHYDLQLDCYTWASSPIRRYIDVIVQRILHSTLENTGVRYTSKEIDWFCAEFSEKHAKQVAYDRKAQCLNMASKLKEQSLRMEAFIADVQPHKNHFNLHFPLNPKSLPCLISVMYRDLQLVEQPEYDGESQCMALKWKQRVYSFANNQVHSGSKQQKATGRMTPVKPGTWKDILSALRSENWGSLCQSLQEINLSVTEDGGCQRNSIGGFSKYAANPAESEHHTELSLNIKAGETLSVQLSTDTARGLLIPALQLLLVHPEFEICLEHAKNPISCFSQNALRASKKEYATYMEYQDIWIPLCEMESAASAVAENDSIVFEDVRVTLTPKENKLRGFFRLSLENKSKWAIDCDLRKCFVCIRMRDCDRNVRPDDRGVERSRHPELSDLVEPPSFTWVAHGMTVKVTDEEKAERLNYVQVDFRINHLSMDKTPESVFGEDTKFTVELIPKLLPDVRKEDAITHLAGANQLVKNVALGKRTLFRGSTDKKWNFEIVNHQSLGLPPLNNSQNKAITEALENAFTLIQGPPGTGKTVVGLYILYWFHVFGRKDTTVRRGTEGGEGPMKKDCVLYCGPSNKSVDVVAEQLVSFQGVLKPLRVYSEQMEILEFPYPDSNLRLSRKSLREEKPNIKLRAITLHHRIRMSENPFSEQIRSFDQRIQEITDITHAEVVSYKKLLNQARQHELRSHDVILCTCTAASNPNFTETLNVTQTVIDECAMATEPEAFIPLVCHKPKQIVLLGDHKQLQPVVGCNLVNKLGMRKSLFERYEERAFMLDTQYRMHERICEFPSKMFYNGLLKTGASQKPSVLRTSSKLPTPIVFGHVEGKEVKLLVPTAQGNENSVANLEEAEHAVRIAGLLTSLSGVEPQKIAIITPYNAQVSKINEILNQRGIQDVTVSTIMKSQGSEWRYVILSTVRSCLKSETEAEPTKGWLRKKLGLVMNPHQVNVGLTRAREGLCIIGNKDLLNCCPLWRSLLKHYYENQAVDTAKNIKVQKTHVKTKSRRDSRRK